MRRKKRGGRRIRKEYEEEEDTPIVSLQMGRRGRNNQKQIEYLIYDTFISSTSAPHITMSMQ